MRPRQASAGRHAKSFHELKRQADEGMAAAIQAAVWKKRPPVTVTFTVGGGTFNAMARASDRDGVSITQWLDTVVQRALNIRAYLKA